MKTKLIISDFDGTLVDTKEANFQAYKEVLSHFDFLLTKEIYHQVFGMRLKEFMHYININDPFIIEQVRNMKAQIYPQYFELIRINTPLLEFIALMRLNGVKTALASTAQKDNVFNLLNHINQSQLFELLQEQMLSRPNPIQNVSYLLWLILTVKLKKHSYLRILLLA